MDDFARVMVVDGKKERLQALWESVDERGYLVSSFNSGADALDALREQRYDVLLLDLDKLDVDVIAFLNKVLEV